MTISIKGISINLNKDDIKKIRDSINTIKNKIDCNLTKTYSVALIDERYNITSYIIEYGKVKLKMKDIEKLINNFKSRVIEESNSFKTYYLKDVFLNYLTDSSGELSGYELDTPCIDNFDIIIKF